MSFPEYRYPDLVTARAAQLFPNVALHPELRYHSVEQLQEIRANLLADPVRGPQYRSEVGVGGRVFDLITALGHRIVARGGRLD